MTTSAFDIASIARICHETNRAYCATLGDYSQPSWYDAPAWQRESAIAGVKAHMAGTLTPAQSHDSWLKVKELAGWVWGETKCPVAKTHPCIKPYDQLPTEQQTKDKLFGAVCAVFKAGAGC